MTEQEEVLEALARRPDDYNYIAWCTMRDGKRLLCPHSHGHQSRVRALMCLQERYPDLSPTLFIHIDAELPQKFLLPSHAIDRI